MDNSEVRPGKDAASERRQSEGSNYQISPVVASRPGFVFAITLASIFLFDALVMFFFPAIGQLSALARSLLNAFLLSVIVAPVLYFFVLRPMRLHIFEQAGAEARFNDVAENAQEWIWEVDANGLYTYASPVVERVLGYPAEELIGKKHFYDLFHPDDREALKEAAFDVFAKREKFREFPNRNVHRDGRVVWLHTSGVPIVDAEGRLAGYRGADADVTRRLEAEKERERLAKELHDSLANEIHILRGIIPICASCKKIRDDAGYWQQVEVYVRDRTEAEFSHGLCPDCAREVEEELEREFPHL